MKRWTSKWDHVKSVMWRLMTLRKTVAIAAVMGVNMFNVN